MGDPEETLRLQPHPLPSITPRGDSPARPPGFRPPRPAHCPVLPARPQAPRPRARPPRGRGRQQWWRRRRQLQQQQQRLQDSHGHQQSISRHRAGETGSCPGLTIEETARKGSNSNSSNNNNNSSNSKSWRAESRRPLQSWTL